MSWSPHASGDQARTKPAPSPLSQAPADTQDIRAERAASCATSFNGACRVRLHAASIAHSIENLTRSLQ
jgi:hypothetical protein